MQSKRSNGKETSRRQRGFTLLEVLIVVVIIGVLAAVALPSYNNYVVRSKLTDAFSILSGMGLSAQRYYQDNRTYEGTGGVNGCPPGVGIADGSNRHFNFRCTNVTASTITMSAEGVGANFAGMVYTLDQNNVRTTVSVPPGWTSPQTRGCWVRSQSGAC